MVSGLGWVDRLDGRSLAGRSIRGDPRRDTVVRVRSDGDTEPEPEPESESVRTTDRSATQDVGTGGLSSDERRLASWLLLAVGTAYFVAQLLLMPLHRPVGWDEAVYLSQVSPRMDALFLEAWHSRGITLLVAPVTALGGSVPDVRLFLMVSSAAAMTLVFKLWIPVIGLAASIAAFLFSFTWLALFNGSVVMPNLWAALLGVGLAACVVRRLEGGTLTYALLAVGMLGAMALVRPTEATVVAGAVGLYVILIRRSSWRLVLGLGAGLVLGWLPWIIEMSIRFGGFRNALRAANSQGHLTVVPVTDHVLAYLGFTYGRAKLPAVGLPTAGLLWWGLLAFLAAIALRRRVGAPARGVALLGIATTLVLAVEYILLVSFIASRFLLPAYAFAAIPAAIGLRSLLRDGLPARILGILVVVAMVPWAVWQGQVAVRVEARESRGGGRFAAAGLLLRDLAGGRPCSFVSPGAYPQIHLASGCDGAQLTFPPRPTRAQWAAVGRGEEVFMILPSEAQAGSRLAPLSPIRFKAPKRTWFIYRLSEARR
jgi:hypothetical protein